MGIMAPWPQHKQQFETFLNAPGAHPFIDQIEPLFIHGPDLHDPNLRRHSVQGEQQQLFWQAGEVNQEHDRLCITLGEFALTVAISHRHDSLEQSTLVFNHWRPELYETKGLMPPMDLTYAGEEAAERFLPLFQHSVAAFGLGRFALSQQDWAHAS